MPLLPPTPRKEREGASEREREIALLHKCLKDQENQQNITLLPATGRSRAGQRNSEIRSKFCS